MVRVFNERGEVRIEAKVTPRIMPGVSAMGQGAWHDARMVGDRIDHGSCINTLTTHRPSPLAKATRSTPIWCRSKRFSTIVVYYTVSILD
jgi:anaerobic selenocysteine-containing dehydrogenase